jgi:hypothetical protein
MIFLLIPYHGNLIEEMLTNSILPLFFFFFMLSGKLVLMTQTTTPNLLSNKKDRISNHHRLQATLNNLCSSSTPRRLQFKITISCNIRYKRWLVWHSSQYDEQVRKSNIYRWGCNKSWYNITIKIAQISYFQSITNNALLVVVVESIPIRF